MPRAKKTLRWWEEITETEFLNLQSNMVPRGWRNHLKKLQRALDTRDPRMGADDIAPELEKVFRSWEIFAFGAPKTEAADIFVMADDILSGGLEEGDINDALDFIDEVIRRLVR